MKSQASSLINQVKEKKAPNTNVKIYTIASGKGGVGKTNIAVGLAICLQRLGRKVLLIDGDFGFANVDVIMGISSRASLTDVILGGMEIEDAIYEGPEGVMVIPGGNGLVDLARADEQIKDSFISQFRKLDRFDTILLDTGGGLSASHMSFLAFADEIILVGTPEPTSITDVYSVMKVISGMKLSKKINLIINRVSSSKEADETFEKLSLASSRFLGMNLEYLGHVRDDSRVPGAVMSQVPINVKFPTSLASRSIEQIAHAISGRQSKGIRFKTMEEVYNRLLKIFG